jgi:hypothetical protein
MYICKNCGKKYNPAPFPFNSPFCCEGCKLEFQNRQNQLYSSQENSGGKSRPRRSKFSSIIIIILILFCIYKCTEKKDNATTPAKTSTNIESVKSE